MMLNGPPCTTTPINVDFHSVISMVLNITIRTRTSDGKGDRTRESKHCLFLSALGLKKVWNRVGAIEIFYSNFMADLFKTDSRHVENKA